MRLRTTIEVEVPDEVGRALLEQQRRYEERRIRTEVHHYVDLDNDYTYTVKAPYRWEEA